MIRFCMNIFLKPALQEDQVDEQLNCGFNTQVNKPKASSSSETQNYKQMIDNMLDSSGPKLFDGGRKVLTYYQIIGLLNWLNAPLYVSLIYKVTVISLAVTITLTKHFLPLISLSLLDLVYQNPIFVFIFCIGATTSAAHFWLTIYINLFKLCPMFKILTTPKMCYLSKEVQLVFGNNNLFLVFIFMVYNTCLIEMLISPGYQEFLTNFSIVSFARDLFSQTVMWYHVIGLAHFDFYIRCCFGSWILGLKINFETRFERFRIYQRRQLARCLNGANNSEYSEDVSSDNFITLDEIQNQLNNMDDHLEAWRSVQVYSLALTSMNAFLSNGTLLLFAYSLLANRTNYYHGLIVVAIAVNYWIVLFFCYSGDQFISHALSKFVQTVEDEYFLQGAGDKMDKLMVSSVDDEYQQLADSLGESGEKTRAQVSKLANNLIEKHKSLLVDKKDVLFCREFLHQFNNHLATPWSRLDFNSHLRMLGTFVTLIAAQIIFDKEH